MEIRNVWRFADILRGQLTKFIQTTTTTKMWERKNERKKKSWHIFSTVLSLVFYLLAIWHTVRQPNTSFNKIKSQFHELSSVVHRTQHEHGAHKLSRSDEHFMKFLPIDWVYWWWVFSSLFLCRLLLLLRFVFVVYLSLSHTIYIKCYRESYVHSTYFVWFGSLGSICLVLRWIFRRVSLIESAVLYHHYAPFFSHFQLWRVRVLWHRAENRGIFVERKIFHITRH